MRLPVPLAVANAAVLMCSVVALGTVQAGAAQPAAVVAVDAPAQAVEPAEAPAVQPAPVPVTEPAPPAQPPSAEPTPPPVQRTTSTTGWAPFATVGPVTLHYPGDVVEVVGLHQSGHDGAQPQSPLAGPARIGRLGSRARDTHEQGAADVVVDPSREVRSPVTGTVLRAGTYTLYCDHVDQYVVVEPDARPGWEVKVLHFAGLAVGKGDRVQAGVTVIGSNARVLPFASQVDGHTAPPHWPHVHIEVVDPSVPDRSSGGSCD